MGKFALYMLHIFRLKSPHGLPVNQIAVGFEKIKITLSIQPQLRSSFQSRSKFYRYPGGDLGMPIHNSAEMFPRNASCFYKIFHLYITRPYIHITQNNAWMRRSTISWNHFCPLYLDTPAKSHFCSRRSQRSEVRKKKSYADCWLLNS